MSRLAQKPPSPPYVSWTRRSAPIGYRIIDGCLVAEPVEAAFVRVLYERFHVTHDLRRVARKLRRELGLPRARDVDTELSGLLRVLQDPVYIGMIRRHATLYRGRHRPIVSRALWQRVQELLIVDFCLDE